MKANIINISIIIILVLGVLFAGCFLLPWDSMNWGKLQLISAQTVTVSGEAKSKQKSQIATFNAGVNSTKDSKDEAVAEVNQKIAAIIDALKKFGIKPEDLKTQNLSIYQSQEQYWEDSRQKTRPGQWQVNASVEITLRDVDRATDLANLLTSSGATNVYGPNFSLDNTQQAEKALLEEAINNAKEKADIMAQATGKKVAKVINIVEGSQTTGYLPMMREAGGGGGGAIEPGSGTVSKTVTVTFELK